MSAPSGPAALVTQKDVTLGCLNLTFAGLPEPTWLQLFAEADRKGFTLTKTITINVGRSDDIDLIKSKIWSITGIETSLCLLTFFPQKTVLQDHIQFRHLRADPCTLHAHTKETAKTAVEAVGPEVPLSQHEMSTQDTSAGSQPRPDFVSSAAGHETRTGRVMPVAQAPRFRYCPKPCANRMRPGWLCTNECGHGSRHRGRCLCRTCFNDDPYEAGRANSRARTGQTGPMAGVPWHFLETRGASDEAVTDSTQPCSEPRCGAFAVGRCDNCWLYHCGAHLGPCATCGRGPFCPVCAIPINHTCMPRRPVPQDP